ncbi:MAG: hypothetical protein U0990_09390 [Candidatus Nanopelagicales bacterium]|nr:hypothetical protein [Candidatus Nanopelagicales bacterium]
MASGDLLAQWGAGNNEYTGANPATIDVDGDRLVLDFDDTTDEFAQFGAKLGATANHYTSSGITVNVYFWLASATTGNVEFEIALQRQATGDDKDRAYVAVNASGAVAVPGTAGLIGVATATFTHGADMDSIAGGNPFNCRINRNVGVASNATGDCSAFQVDVLET